MLISKKFVPSLFTILNAICGFMSIINASNGLYDEACYFIVYATLFDMIDGLAARITKSSSDFGVELDSLSDVISFGVAPSYLLYAIHFKNFNGIGIFVSASIMAFSAIRLARFNISLTGYDKDKFIGLSTTAAALTIASYVLYYHNKLFSVELSNIFIFILTLGLAVIMVSRFQYSALPKFSSRSLKEKPIHFIILILVVIISIYTKGASVFPILMLYVLSGIFISIYNKIFHHRNVERVIKKNATAKRNLP